MRRRRNNYFVPRTFFGSYFTFLLFFSIVLSVIIYSTIAIKVDLTKTYECQITENDSQVLLVVQGKVTSDFEHLYVYYDKNMKVNRFKKISLSIDDDKTYIGIQGSSETAAFIQDSKAKILYAEIPQEKESLYNRMFTLGDR